MYFIILQANLELFKLLKSKEFSTPYHPRWEGSEQTQPTPLPPKKNWEGGEGGKSSDQFL